MTATHRASEGELNTKTRPPRVLVDLFPTYRSVRHLLPVWEGRRSSDITSLRAKLRSLMGSRTDRRIWADPDVWARELLEGTDRDLATSIWRQSRGEVNPRYTKGAWNLVCRYQLVVDRRGWLSLTDRGRDFLDHETSETVTILDRCEGLVDLLKVIADKGSASRRDLYPVWETFLGACSSPFGSPSTRRSSLGFRLKNLTDRGLVAAAGRDHSMTASGRQYVSRVYVRASEVVCIGRP